MMMEGAQVGLANVGIFLSDDLLQELGFSYRREILTHTQRAVDVVQGASRTRVREHGSRTLFDMRQLDLRARRAPRRAAERVSERY